MGMESLTLLRSLRSDSKLRSLLQYFALTIFWIVPTWSRSIRITSLVIRFINTDNFLVTFSRCANGSILMSLDLIWFKWWVNVVSCWSRSFVSPLKQLFPRLCSYFRSTFDNVFIDSFILSVGVIQLVTFEESFWFGEWVEMFGSGVIGGVIGDLSVIWFEQWHWIK